MLFRSGYAEGDYVRIAAPLAGALTSLPVSAGHTLVRAQAERHYVARQVIAEKFELAGQTLCVIGLGDIGGTLAQKAKALGMRVIGVRRTTAPFAGLDAQYTPEQLPDALPQAGERTR